MKYQITINGGLLQPTNGEPYEFDTLQEAVNILEMTYGLESLKTYAKIIEK
jgi:hypothetical protein